MFHLLAGKKRRKVAILVPRFPTDFKIKAPGDPIAGQLIVGSGIEDRERGSPGDIKREQGKLCESTGRWGRKQRKVNNNSGIEV